MVGRALQTGSELALQPLMDVLRRKLGQKHTPPDLGSPVWLAELARLLPELRLRYPDLPILSTGEALGHSRLFEAIARLLQHWAARRPLVLLLDDLQWADTATLDLLIYLARRLTEQPVPLLLLLNLSTEAGGCTAEQANWPMALKRTRLPLTELLLTPFSKEEVRRFVQALAWAEQPLEGERTCSTGGCPVSGEAAMGREALLSLTDWLYRQTSGQPLYLVETFKGLMAQGIISPSLQKNGAWGLMLMPEALTHTSGGELIPQSLRELIRAQLARLSPSAWTMLVAGAALEAGLTFERLCQVAGLDELEGLPALEELLRGGWLSEATALAESQLCDSYAFPREIIREVVYKEAGATRRRLVQRRLAAIIRAGIADEQGEEAGAPHATPTEEHVQAEKRTGPGLPVLAGTSSSRPGSLWSNRKEERDALRTTHPATSHVPGAKNPGWRSGHAGPGG